MKKSSIAAGRLERVEAAYLQALRIAGLLIATLCLVAALFFAGNAAWRLAVSTNVEPEPTAIDTAVIAQQVAATPQENEDGPTIKAPDAALTAHEAFKKNVWVNYYAIYQRAYQANRNNADRLVSSDDLMAQLGYSLETYRRALESSDEYEAQRILRMVQDADYQAAAIKHVTEIMTSTAVTAKLNSYKTATKSEQDCSSTPRSVYVSRLCGNYYYNYECGGYQTVYDRRCEAVFPKSVVTPVTAFARADAFFAMSWLDDESSKAEAAQDERLERELTRSAIGPNVQLALMIIGGFFVVMFFFLLVAIERHLRPSKPEATQ